MSIIGTGVNFAAYLADGVDHAFGGSSNLAASTELLTGDVGQAGNQDATADQNSTTSADQLADIQNSENSTLPPAGLGALGSLASNVPWWAWAIGAGAAGIALLVVLGPYVGFLPKSK